MKKIAGLIAAVAMVVTGAASMGCVLLLCDEPKAIKGMD